MKKLITIFMICIAMLALGLTACGNEQVTEQKMMVEETAAAGIMEEAAYDTYYDAGYAGGFSNDGGSTTVADPNRKLIKDVSLEIETKEYESLLASIREKITALGGYVENSSLSSPSTNDTYRSSRHANITARVPSDKLDEFVNGISKEGNVTYKSENVTDITLQYTDTESRKKSLLVEQDRLNEMMKKAETVEDLIAIESRLSEVRYELESIESQLRTYDNQVDYSTVYIGISEVVEYSPQEDTTIWEQIKSGFNNCINGLGEFFKGLFVFVIAYSPLLILIAAVVVVVVVIVKKIKKNKKKKSAQVDET